jgi:phage terminase large subunit-like protein
LTWTELRRTGLRQCRACKVEKFFENVLFLPLGFHFPTWSRKVLRDLYGTLDQDSGLRQYRTAYISMAKQNGKSNLIGGLPIYHILMEDEVNPEVVGAAAAKDQAEIVFKASSHMINSNPSLMTRLRIIPSTKRILEREGPGLYKVVSADGDVQDGQRPSLLLRDEIHRWKTLRHETVKDVLTKGQISRDEPLDIQITTSGAEYECQLWWKEYCHAKAVQLDPSLDPSYYVCIYQADLDKITQDPEFWKTREARVQANPSHEDLGGHLRDVALISEMNKAISDPSEKPKYLKYNLNVPLRSTEDPIIDMTAWMKNGDPLQVEADQANKTNLVVDLRTWPTFDEDLLIRNWKLLEQPCFGGVDASWTTDFTANVYLFPPTPTNELWTFLPFFWLAKDRIPELERTTRMPLRTWVERGFITATPGDTIDMTAVKNRIKWANEMFDLLEVDYDRANFRTEATALQTEGIQMVEVKQNFMELSPATKFVLSGVLSRSFRHGNNPVLNWMAACLQVQYDRKDNVQPSKPERMKSARRIDGMSAIITALARALVIPGKRKVSVYATRGLRTI